MMTYASFLHFRCLSYVTCAAFPVIDTTTRSNPTPIIQKG